MHISGKKFGLSRQKVYIFSKTKKGMVVAKSERLYFRVEPEQRTAFQRAAELSGLPLSIWGSRQRLRFAAVNELEATGEKVPFIAPVPLRDPDQ